MKWKEKIRSMNDDELAEFMVSSSAYEGFQDEACRLCIYRRSDGECSSEFLTRDCKAAVKKLLESEVPDDEAK
ncbi:MAG: hypothetical protein E7578_07280 [Ruminococcaceae bacterium]|nr:hypothetical protein [Oscillospiraceae bacterium]